MSHPSGGDRIFLHGLTAECIIGFIDWERRVRQTVVLDIELPVDCRHAALTDEVADTLIQLAIGARAAQNVTVIVSDIAIRDD